MKNTFKKITFISCILLLTNMALANHLTITIHNDDSNTSNYKSNYAFTTTDFFDPIHSATPGSSASKREFDNLTS